MLLFGCPLAYGQEYYDINGEKIDSSVVSATKDYGANLTRMGNLSLRKADVMKIPALIGEHDVLKGLQLLPGVQQGEDGTSGLTIRGGGLDENLMILDGVPIYQCMHLLGVTSIFPVELIDKVDVYKEAFPARYGGRVSGVVDVSTWSEFPEKINGEISLGVLSSNLMVKAPMVSKRASILVYGKVANTIMARPFMEKYDMKFGYYFYDLYSKFNYSFRNGDKLSASVYAGADDFDYVSDDRIVFDKNGKQFIHHEAFGSDWMNDVAVVSWKHDYGNNLSSDIKVSFYSYSAKTFTREFNHEMGKTFSDSSRVENNSRIMDVQVSGDFEWRPWETHDIHFGSTFLHHSYMPSTSFVYESDDAYPVITNSGVLKTGGFEASLYFEDDCKLSDRISFCPGLRLSLLGIGKKCYFSPEPRISIRYGFMKDASVKLSYSRMSQFSHLLTASRMSLPTDLWVPITETIQPEYADQFAIGAFFDLKYGLFLSAELFYKSQKNVVEYIDGASFIGNANGWDTQVDVGRGRSYGLEVFLQRRYGKTTGWVGYTLQKSERIFESGLVNCGKWFPFRYDRRHKFDICVNHTFNDLVSLSGTWTIASGSMMSIQDGVRIAENGIALPYYSSRNNYRLPPTHRLNVSVDFEKRYRKVETLWSVSVYNVYNYMSPNIVLAGHMWVDDEVSTTEGDSEYMMTKITYLPILPSLSFTLRF